MKVSYEWLKDFVEIKLSPEKLAHRLTMGGIEVESIEMLGKDAVFELGITPNRADCLSIVGVAREIAAVTGARFRNAAVKQPRGQGAIAERLKVTVKNRARCHRYTARVIEGVKVGPSPAWLVRRLAAAGIRSINNIVDATNYVMVERGQPLHAFDAAMIHGGRIVVRTAGAQTVFRSLDGVERSLEADDLLICDAERPVALAGVMGGENSEVAPTTTAVVLESACFAASGVRRTSKRLCLMSESSRRFERGVDPNGVMDALNRLTAIIVEVAGGTPTADAIDIYPQKIRPQKVTIQPGDIERIVGIKFTSAGIRQMLVRLGFGVAGTSKRLTLSVPTWRSDVSRTIDIVEEIARLYGYDRIPATLPRAPVRRLTLPRTYEHAEAASGMLADLGFSETVLSSFESEDALAAFAGDGDVSPPIIANPLSREESTMRTQLMPGLLSVLALNMSHQRRDLKLFALQRVYQRPVGTVRASEPLKIAGVLFGRRNPLSWQSNTQPVDFYDAKGAVEAVLSRLRLDEQVLFQRGGSYGFLVPGCYATVLCENNRVGWVGQLHPQTLARWEIDDAVFAFELDFDVIATQARAVKPRFRELSRYPRVQRDLSILVDAGIPHVEIESTISQSQSTLLTDIRLFDVYRGSGIPASKKSMAYTVHYSSDERTLTDDEVNEAHARVIAAVETKLGAVLR